MKGTFTFRHSARMTIIGGFFSINCLIFVSPLVYAQEIQLDDATKEICNKVILNIYDEILRAKDKYPELSSFDQNVLSKNQYGIYSISYRYQDPRIKNRPEPYELRITIVGMNDKPYHYPGFEEEHDGYVTFTSGSTVGADVNLDTLVSELADNVLGAMGIKIVLSKVTPAPNVSALNPESRSGEERADQNLVPNGSKPRRELPDS